MTEANSTAGSTAGSTVGSTLGSAPGKVITPAWKDELKERVRQIREKRNTGDLVAPVSAPVEPVKAIGDQNPRVASALNRIRWASHTPAITTTVSGKNQGGRATAAARLPQIEDEPGSAPEPNPQYRPEPRLDQRPVPSKSTQAGQTSLYRNLGRESGRETGRDIGRVTNREIGRGLNRTGVQPGVGPAPTNGRFGKPGEQTKPQTTTRITNPLTDKLGSQATHPAGASPIVKPNGPNGPIETRSLTPKPRRESGLRTESEPAPASRILTPRTQPRVTAETKAEPKIESRFERREAELPQQPAVDRDAENKHADDQPLAGKPLTPDKHVDTQVIEIAQAPEPLPFPEPAPATLWVRTMAGACDADIIAIAYLPLFWAFAMMKTSVGPQSGFIMMLLLSALVFVYQLVMLTFASRTFGMALFNLHLVNSDDESLVISHRQKVLRALASTFVFIFFPFHLVTRLSLSRRSLPDWVSGTTVTEL
jgi:uncharacterized RDD family membrane protein YckC